MKNMNIRNALFKSHYEMGMEAGRWKASLKQTRELRITLIGAVMRARTSDYWRGYKDAYAQQVPQGKVEAIDIQC